MNTPTSLPGFLIGEQLPEPPGSAAQPVETELAEYGPNLNEPSPVSGDGIGKVVPAAKATGRYPYASDLGVPGMLWAAMTRSPHARATIVGCDSSAAKALPGVHAVLAGEELGVGEIDYLGQCVAIAAAEHPAIARAALNAVVIDYQPEEPLTDPRQAFNAAPIHSDGNIAAHRFFTTAREAARESVEALRKKAPSTRRAAALHVPRPEPESEVPAKTVSVIHGYEFARPADWPAGPGTVFAVPHGDGVEIHTLTVDPRRDRRALAAALGRPESQIRLVPAPFTGGAIADDADLRVAAALLAARTGRPIKAVDSSVGHWPAGTAEPAARVHAIHVVDSDGTLREVRVELVIDGGAEPAAAEALLDEYCRLAAGPYRVPKVQVQGWVVRTHNPPLAPWPGGGAALAAVVAEAQMDAVAAALGVSGLEVRVKNLMRTGDRLPDGRKVVAADMLPELVTAVLDAPVPPFPPGPDVREFPGTVGRTGEMTRLRRGVGIALAMIDLVPPGLPEELATAQVALTSDVHGPIAHVSTAMVETGGGQHALLRKIVREVLGVQRVLVRRPTAPGALPATPLASGRAAWLHGMAVQRAARGVRAQALAAVAAEFAVSPELLEVRGDRVVSYDGMLSRPLDDVYRAALRGAAVYLADGEFRVRGSGPAQPGVFVPEKGQAHVAFAVHRAVVDADTELGLIRPVRVTAAHDAGRALVPGRIEAAIAAGVISAATAVFADEAPAARATAGALACAQLPTALDLPEVDVLPPLQSSIGDLETTALRRRGFSAPLPLGYQPVGRIAHATAAAALACAARDALGTHRTSIPIRAWESGPKR
ncbi:MAG TPA: molybdopterin cofactor-binding domain-containing protein [Actinocrinis sp.]|uniref:xanthine dehydrogenase family protein molybdopterin-binding subunit n=1 Tax=Actinocrinis sp. TaxID=1920516 RepID=UPI002DDCB2A8|nr:molybdopterin cofactor-binding domain-containing protein [Actinocrinis sp.]HEV2343338.1 molybdopterin cofactor-binding domain-containing protein [Actinocrinis sp.]